MRQSASFTMCENRMQYKRERIGQSAGWLRNDVGILLLMEVKQWKLIV